MTRTALLLVDLQNDVLHADGKMAGDFPAQAEPVLEACARWSRGRAGRADPVVWLRLAFRADHVDAVLRLAQPSRRRAGGRDLGSGDPGRNGLGRRGHHHHQEAAERVLPDRAGPRPARARRRRLVVGGVSTNWAVESTVRDGHSHDFRMIVVREAVGTPFSELHESSLRSMQTVFADVVSLSEVIGNGPG